MLPTQIFFKMALGERLAMPEVIPSGMAELPALISDCWQSSPEKRPTFKEVHARTHPPTHPRTHVCTRTQVVARLQ